MAMWCTTCFVTIVAAWSLCTVRGASCVGRDPAFEAACEKFANETACMEQVVCVWYDPGSQQCFAANGNPSIDALCKKFSTFTACSKQVGCTWGSSANATAWYAMITTSVSALHANTPTIPTSIGIGSPEAMSMHDHQVVANTSIDVILNAWKNKFTNFPTSVMTSLKALVFVPSLSYNGFHTVVQSPNSVVDVFAAAGRNWGGMISLAFVQAHATVSVQTFVPNLHCGYHSKDDAVCVGPASECCISSSDDEFCPDGHGCYWCGDAGDANCGTIPSNRGLTNEEVAAVTQLLQASAFPKMQAEADLLKHELLPGSFRLATVVV